MFKAAGPVGLMCEPPDTSWVLPGAYCTDGTRLLEIRAVSDVQGVTYVDCRSEAIHVSRLLFVADQFTPVKQAPSAPDNLSSLTL